MLPIKATVGILADNLRLRKSVSPMSRRRTTRWAEGLDIPRGGETVIYTGHMYQLMPSIVSMEKMTAMLEDTWVTKFFSLGLIPNKFINMSWFMAWPSAREQKEYDNLVRNIARLLKAAKVDFGYLYGDEVYAGALVHDQGVDDVFEMHARKVYEGLKAHGVKRVITVDPHTTNMLRSVYPKIIKGYDIEAKSYLEVLAERDMKPCKNLGMGLAIHDSCVYARYENVVDEPRRLLKKAGVTLNEPDNSGKLTFCCGGPIESLFPRKTQEIAENRMEQLSSRSKNVAAMCPICLVNLKKAAAKKDKGVSVKDISEYLAEAYCGSDIQ